MSKKHKKNHPQYEKDETKHLEREIKRRIDFFIHFLKEQNERKIKTNMLILFSGNQYNIGWSNVLLFNNDDDLMDFTDEHDDSDDYVVKHPDQLDDIDKRVLYKEYQFEKDFADIVDEIFFYKQISDLLKYNMYSEPFNSDTISLSIHSPDGEQLIRKWKEMRNDIHKGRIDGQMAVNRMLNEQAQFQGNLRPVDIAKYIGTQTEMEGGGKKDKEFIDRFKDTWDNLSTDREFKTKVEQRIRELLSDTSAPLHVSLIYNILDHMFWKEHPEWRIFKNIYPYSNINKSLQSILRSMISVGKLSIYDENENLLDVEKDDWTDYVKTKGRVSIPHSSEMLQLTMGKILGPEHSYTGRKIAKNFADEYKMKRGGGRSYKFKRAERCRGCGKRH